MTINLAYYFTYSINSNRFGCNFNVIVSLAVLVVQLELHLALVGLG